MVLRISATCSVGVFMEMESVSDLRAVVAEMLVTPDKKKASKELSNVGQLCLSTWQFCVLITIYVTYYELCFMQSIVYNSKCGSL